MRRGVVADNCGACSLACSSNNVTPLCSGGVCSGPCLNGFSDCNNNKAIDGCESNTLSDPSNCGSCGSPCSSNHVTPSCTGGHCQGTCQAGWGNCDGDLRSNGCETDVSSSTTIITQASPEFQTHYSLIRLHLAGWTGTDVLSCGGCGVMCSTNRVSQVCTNGTCAGTCVPPWLDCDNNKQIDGCEINSFADPSMRRFL